MIKDRRLGHLGMASRDVDATVAWYVDVLGFEKIGEFKAPNGKIAHYCFESEDVEKDYEYGLEQGYTITTEGIEELPGLWERGVRFFNIGTPTGQQVEFSQIL